MKCSVGPASCASRARPSTRFHWPSEPKSARHSWTRRVCNCRSNSAVTPMAPCTACAIEVAKVAASLQRALASAARSGTGSGPLPLQPISAAMRAAADCSASTASWCWMVWNLPIERPNCSRWLAKATVICSTRSMAPASCAAAIAAPASSSAAGCAETSASAGRDDHDRSARRLPWMPLAPRSAAATGSSHQPSGLCAATQSATMPPGVPGQLMRPSAARCSRGAMTIAPPGASRPSRASSARTSIVCASGNGKACRPSITNSSKASPGSSPAPPAVSGTSTSRGNPIRRGSPTARQSMPRPRSGARPAVCRDRPAAGRAAGSQSVVHRSPSPRAISPRRISRVPPRSEKVGANCVT